MPSRDIKLKLYAWSFKKAREQRQYIINVQYLALQIRGAKIKTFEAFSFLSFL